MPDTLALPTPAIPAPVPPASLPTASSPAVPVSGLKQEPAVLLAQAPTRSLAEIRAPIEADLAAFQQHFRAAMKSNVWLLDRVTQYILKHKGKQIRPILVLLAARLLGEVSDTTYRGAALVELLHTATLVHDDVVDDAETRRGVFSIKALWKNKVGVLLGDYLLSRGLLLALDAKDYDLLHTVSDAVRRMAEGELSQLEHSRRLDTTEAIYFQIISDKTASLIAACLACGAISVTDDETTVARLRHVGETLGLAFQIRDDLFDYGDVDVGKPLGNDVQERKLTLPLIYALDQAAPREAKAIRKLVKRRKKTRADVDRVVRFVYDNGGVAYARARMEALAAEAIGDLLTFPESEARTALLGLAKFIVARKR